MGDQGNMPSSCILDMLDLHIGAIGHRTIYGIMDLVGGIHSSGAGPPSKKRAMTHVCSLVNLEAEDSDGAGEVRSTPVYCAVRALTSSDLTTLAYERA